MSTIAPRQSEVPGPITLLAIQAGGGFLSVLPIMSLNQFAKLTETLHQILLGFSVVNAIFATVLLVGFVSESRFSNKVLQRIGELGLCRRMLFYDIVMLGALVYCTGGSQQSVFTLQFAAVLPMAMLIRDSPAMKWAYAAVFLLIFLLGLQPNEAFQGYLSTGEQQKERWFLVFFFIFTLFPVVYSIQTERTTDDTSKR